MDMQLAPLLEEKYNPTSAAPSIVFFGVPQILMSIYPLFFSTCIFASRACR
jgi:hypothetical protein